MKLKPYKTAAILLTVGLAANGAYDLYYRTQFSIAPRVVVQQAALNNPIPYPSGTKLDKDSKVLSRQAYAFASEAEKRAFYEPYVDREPAPQMRKPQLEGK